MLTGAKKRRAFAVGLVTVLTLLSPAALTPAAASAVAPAVASAEPALAAVGPVQGGTIEVRGRVVDARDGMPIAGAGVHASRSGITRPTQGRVDFTQPGALNGWHYAAGLRGNAGTQAISRLEGRSASG
ncbi:hypothetical protein [Nonomuraea sp. NPDC049625]|uniref:hypothetical protein n=1 Tax=Nonomuraea sp. NPDC049625 TaxID=3155775 RepID=UPI003446D310